MSFFCEKIIGPDLSEKTIEELISSKTELNNTRLEIGKEYVDIKKKYRSVENEISNIDKNLKIILEEIKRRNDELTIDENIKKIEGFDLLSKDELLIITTNMDKTDYRKNGDYPRFYDLERICKEIIVMKKRYPRWTLTNLGRGGQYDTLPPLTFYRYEYKDEFNCSFNNFNKCL